ncbi:MAG: hypothetical protein WBY88_07955 [Desulfosarcina sp.]
MPLPASKGTELCTLESLIGVFGNHRHVGDVAVPEHAIGNEEVGNLGCFVVGAATKMTKNMATMPMRMVRLRMFDLHQRFDLFGIETFCGQA